MFIPRKLLTKIEPWLAKKENIIITGFRRVGKTTLLRYLFNMVPSTNKIFLDLENPYNRNLIDATDYDRFKLIIKKNGLNLAQRLHVFLDEIQFVKTIPSFVKYLSDHNDIKFYLTGSSSFYLKNLFTESLAGRKIIFELYPLDFEEFLNFKKLSPSESLDRNGDLLYQEYLTWGGFPSVVLQETNDQKSLSLDEIIAAYFQLDVKTLANFHDLGNIERLLPLLTERVSSKVDVGKLAGDLSVSRQTIHNYLDFLEQTYAIHSLKPYSSSPDVGQRGMAKIYFNDTGILTKIGRNSLGELFENKVFNQLFFRFGSSQVPLTSRLSYYQSRDKAEIDFVVDTTAYEVKISGTEHDLVRLRKISNKLGLREAKIITLHRPTRPHPGIIPASEL